MQTLRTASTHKTHLSHSRGFTTPPALFDYWLVFAVLALAIFGLVMVASASIMISGQLYHQPFHFLLRQAGYLAMGVLLGAVIIQFDTAQWEKMSSGLLIAVMVMLLLVLLPGIGHSINGSRRWLALGPLGFQVSELAKLITVIYMAGYLVRHAEAIKTTLGGFLNPMALLSVIALLLLKEPDFGAMVVILATALGMMFLAGMRMRHFILLIIVVGVAVAILAVAAPYRMARLTTFLNPWANPFGSGYQLTQSLIAFGRGGWFGLGLGNSIQKLFYLPEAYTDFLFAVIAEELGLMGLLALTGLFMLLITRILLIGRRAQLLGRQFAGLLSYGLGFWLVIQFLVSVGVNCGVLPTKGLTLPLVSYGGSSMLMNCIAIALILRVDYENRVFST